MEKLKFLQAKYYNYLKLLFIKVSTAYLIKFKLNRVCWIRTESKSLICKGGQINNLNGGLKLAVW